MDNRVDLGGLQDFDDERVADVGADELGALELDGGLLEIDADDRLDAGVLLEALSETTSQEAGDPRYQDALSGHRGPG